MEGEACGSIQLIYTQWAHQSVSASSSAHTALSVGASACALSPGPRLAGAHLAGLGKSLGSLGLACQEVTWVLEAPHLSFCSGWNRIPDR